MYANQQPQHPGGYPPQGQYPPQQGFPPQQGYPPQGFPPQGYPPQQQYGAPMMMSPPSPGYMPGAMAQGDASNDAAALRKAMKGFGTDDSVLIRTLSKPDPLQMALLRETYKRNIGRNLVVDIEGETSGHYRDTLLALVRGPLETDVLNVRKAIDGLGTNEDLLNDIVLNRSNADLNAIKHAFHAQTGRTLETEILNDLSFKTKDLFKIVLEARRNDESAPCLPHEIDKDVQDLHHALTSSLVSKDTMTICGILATRSNGQLRAITHAYQTRYHSSLEKQIERNFTAHMETALLQILRTAVDPAMADAIALEATMAGPGTRDTLLLNRVVRAHWNRAHLDQVRRAYQHKYGKTLASRVTSETSGDYKKLLVACVEA